MLRINFFKKVDVNNSFEIIINAHQTAWPLVHQQACQVHSETGEWRLQHLPSLPTPTLDHRLLLPHRRHRTEYSPQLLLKIGSAPVRKCKKKFFRTWASPLEQSRSPSRDVRKTINWLGFGFKNRTIQNMTSIQTVFRQKLRAICNSALIKMTHNVY